MRVADILRDKGSDVVTIEDHKTVHDAICTLFSAIVNFPLDHKLVEGAMHL